MSDKVREFSSTQIDLPLQVASRLKQLSREIPDSELYDTEEGGFGREADAHVTVKFGLHTDDYREVERIVSGFGPIRVKFGPVQLFKSDDYDVVFVSVESDDLQKLNKMIAAGTEVTDTHPVYKPHATVAYVLPGEGAKYKGDKSLAGLEIEVDEITFSGKDSSKVMIPTNGRRSERMTIANELIERVVRGETPEAVVEFAWARSGPADKVLGMDLYQFIINDGDLYRQMTIPIIKNLLTKRARGTFDEAKALKAWLNLADAGAKKYAKEFGYEPGSSRPEVGPNMGGFNKKTRELVAKSLWEYYGDDMDLGNYDHLLPKKYQKK